MTCKNWDQMERFNTQEERLKEEGYLIQLPLKSSGQIEQHFTDRDRENKGKDFCCPKEVQEVVRLQEKGTL